MLSDHLQADGGRAVTPLMTQTADALNRASAGSWTRIEDVWYTLFWSSEPLAVPPDALTDGWPEPTYRRRLFLSVLQGSANWSVVVRAYDTPWSKSRLHKLSLTRAIQVLDRPDEFWSINV